MTNIYAPHFTNEDKAREHLEALRWPEGPFCPHCGSFDAKRLEGSKHRKGLVQCNDCRQQFTVTVGTVFERSKVPLHKWLLVNHLMCASKKGISAHQVHRMIGVTYKTAWFMCHRIREAMRSKDETPMGSGGGIVEVDETFIGREPDAKKFSTKSGYYHKMKVLALVDRDTGRSRARVIDFIAADIIKPIIRENLAAEANIVTDDARVYRRLNKEFASHQSVNHTAGEWGRGEIHTNTIEGYFSIFKRGMKGIYQHCSKAHLHRYLAEYDFRYSFRSACGFADAERADEALKGIYGRRLTYRRACLQS